MFSILATTLLKLPSSPATGVMYSILAIMLLKLPCDGIVFHASRCATEAPLRRDYCFFMLAAVLLKLPCHRTIFFQLAWLWIWPSLLSTKYFSRNCLGRKCNQKENWPPYLMMLWPRICKPRQHHGWHAHLPFRSSCVQFSSETELKKKKTQLILASRWTQSRLPTRAKMSSKSSPYNSSLPLILFFVCFFF